MAHKTEKQRFYPNFHNFPHNPRAHILCLRFHKDSISVKISSNTFRNLEILYKI